MIEISDLKSDSEAYTFKIHIDKEETVFANINKVLYLTDKNKLTLNLFHTNSKGSIKHQNIYFTSDFLKNNIDKINSKLFGSSKHFVIVNNLVFKLENINENNMLNLICFMVKNKNKTINSQELSKFNLKKNDCWEKMSKSKIISWEVIKIIFIIFSLTTATVLFVLILAYYFPRLTEFLFTKLTFVKPVFYKPFFIKKI